MKKIVEMYNEHELIEPVNPVILKATFEKLEKRNFHIVTLEVNQMIDSSSFI